MALKTFSVTEAVGLLTVCGSGDEEEPSEDEIIGDFAANSGESVLLSSEMLSRVLAMTVAPLALEIDSLLLGEEDGDVAEEGRDCGEGSANRHDKTGNYSMLLHLLKMQECLKNGSGGVYHTSFL